MSGALNKPLKNANVLQIESGKYRTTPLYSETTKLENKRFLIKKTLKKCKTKKTMPFL